MSFCITSQVIQLTGFSDPVYAEAYVLVNQYDIALDVLVVNQTSDTLQGLTLELATLGRHVCVDVRRVRFVRYVGVTVFKISCVVYELSMIV